MNKKISIIIPTYNEASTITETIALINQHLRDKADYEIIIADDDSPDGTWKIVQKLENKFPVKLLRRTTKKGLSLAVNDAFKITEGEIIGVMDADLSHPPERIIDFLEKFTDPEIDIVWGSRLVQGGGVEKWPISRKLISLGARILMKPLTNIKDTMSGFFFFRKKILKGVVLKPRGYKIGLEIIIRCPYNKAVEIPYVFRNRLTGESKLNARIYLQYLHQLFDLYKFKLFGK